MNILHIAKDGGTHQQSIKTFDELKNLTLPNTKVVQMHDGVHLLVHSGKTEGNMDEINDIATLLCVNGSNCQDLVFGAAIIIDVATFYDLK